MAWRGLAVVTAVFIAISAPLASRPTFKGLLGGDDDTTPAPRTSRRRATAAGRKLAVPRRRQSIARGAGGFAVAPFERTTGAARGGGARRLRRGDGGARRLQRGLIATDDNWLEDYCWSFDRRNQCNSDPCCEWDGDYCSQTDACDGFEFTDDGTAIIDDDGLWDDYCAASGNRRQCNDTPCCHWHQGVCEAEGDTCEVHIGDDDGEGRDEEEDDYDDDDEGGDEEEDEEEDDDDFSYRYDDDDEDDETEDEEEYDDDDDDEAVDEEEDEEECFEEDDEGCEDDWQCCQEDHKCYQRNDDMAFCRRSCPDDPRWDCWEPPKTPRPVPRPTRAPTTTTRRPTAQPTQRPIPRPTAKPESPCRNGRRDGDETDVDCGGSECGPCDEGDRCRKTNDCWSPLLCIDARCEFRPSPRPTQKPVADEAEDEEEEPPPEDEDEEDEDEPPPEDEDEGDEDDCVDEEERCSDDSDCCEGSCYGTTDGSGEFCHSECPEDPDYKCFEPPETPRPSHEPSYMPTYRPSVAATPRPVPRPTLDPTRRPSPRPTQEPTKRPQSAPTRRPTPRPTLRPTSRPTVATPRPTKRPTPMPTKRPSPRPTLEPTRRPTFKPTLATPRPSREPTRRPSPRPTIHMCRNGIKDGQETSVDCGGSLCGPCDEGEKCRQNDDCDGSLNCIDDRCRFRPSARPTIEPSRQPSRKPTIEPSRQPTRKPIAMPTRKPTPEPSRKPSAEPTRMPSRKPSLQPTTPKPSTAAGDPSAAPVYASTPRPTAPAPSTRPTERPTEQGVALSVALKGVDAFDAFDPAAFEAAATEALDVRCSDAVARLARRRRLLADGDAIVDFVAYASDAKRRLADALENGIFADALSTRFFTVDVDRSLALLDGEDGADKGDTGSTGDDTVNDGDPTESRPPVGPGEEDAGDDSGGGGSSSSKKKGRSTTSLALAIGGGIAGVILLCCFLAFGMGLGGGWALPSLKRHRRRSARPLDTTRDVELGSERSSESEGKEESVDERLLSLRLSENAEGSIWVRQGRAVVLDDAPRVRWPAKPAHFVRRLKPGGIELAAAAAGFELARDLDATLKRDLAACGHWPKDQRVSTFRTRVNGLRTDWQDGCLRDVVVRRDHAFEDCYARLGALRDEQWRWPWFFSIQGEVGLDAGGVGREVLRLATNDLCSLDLGLFRHATDDAMTYALRDDEEVATSAGAAGLRYLTFAGKLAGKALIDATQLDAEFNPVLLKHVCGAPCGLDDLQDLDVDLWRSLAQLTDIDVTDLCLTFSVESRSYGKLESRDLIPGGADVAVTEDNKAEYVARRVEDALLRTSRKNTEAFLRGVYAVIPPELFLLVSSRDVALMLSGLPNIDVDEWCAATRYRGAFATKKADHTVVKWFWEALRSFTPEQRAQLLQWTTGHARVPVQGFSHLQGRDGVLRKFTLTSLELSQGIYPRAHTCFNRIDVPLYETKQDLVKGFEFVLELGDQTFSMD